MPRFPVRSRCQEGRPSCTIKRLRDVWILLTWVNSHFNTAHLVVTCGSGKRPFQLSSKQPIHRDIQLGIKRICWPKFSRIKSRCKRDKVQLHSTHLVQSSRCTLHIAATVVQEQPCQNPWRVYNPFHHPLYICDVLFVPESWEIWQLFSSFKDGLRKPQSISSPSWLEILDLAQGQPLVRLPGRSPQKYLRCLSHSSEKGKWCIPWSSYWMYTFNNIPLQHQLSTLPQHRFV